MQATLLEVTPKPKQTHLGWISMPNPLLLLLLLLLARHLVMDPSLSVEPHHGIPLPPMSNLLAHNSTIHHTWDLKREFACQPSTVTLFIPRAMFQHPLSQVLEVSQQLLIYLVDISTARHVSSAASDALCFRLYFIYICVSCFFSLPFPVFCHPSMSSHSL